jgi:ribosome-associated toxin RatA of RatAB toxin-antitoxin module
MKIFLGVIFCVATVFLSPCAKAVDFTKQEVARLAEGKMIRKPLPNSRKNGFYGGAGFAVIDASPETVWAALADYTSYSEIFPRTVEAKELSRRDNDSLICVRMGYKILNIQYHLVTSRDWNKRTLRFTLEKSKPHDITATRGYWKLLPQEGGRTLVAYAVAVQIPVGIVAFLGDSVERSLERSLIGLPKYLKKWLEGPAGSRYAAAENRGKK